MTIIKIDSYNNGGHANQTSDIPFPIPDGYALLPEELGTPEILENFPFGNITTVEIDGVSVVTSWEPLPILKSEPIDTSAEPSNPYDQVLNAFIQ